MRIVLTRWRDLGCPVFVCESCGEPVQGEPEGVVVWLPVPYGEEDFHVVHQGACDRQFSAGKTHMLSRDLGEFVTQLANNTANPLPAEEDE